jgi:hypothetical protein
MLETELQYLNSHKDELLGQFGDKLLVISGEQVTGAFDTIEEALAGAVTRHGLNNVLIRRPSEVELELTAPALTLGVLGADSPFSSHGPGEIA